MLKELESTFGFEPWFLLDNTSTHVEDNHSNDTRGGHYFLGPQVFSQVIVRRKLASLIEINYLMTDHNVVIVGEVLERYRELLSNLKKREEDCGSSRKLPGFGHKWPNLEYLPEYITALEKTKELMRGRDPRNKDFINLDKFRIDRSDPVYQDTLAQAKELMLGVLESRHKTDRQKTKGSADAHVFTMAHMLQSKGYRTCIISRNCDYYRVALRFGRNVQVYSQPGVREGVATTITGDKCYSISIFNPLFLLPKANPTTTVLAR